MSISGTGSWSYSLDAANRLTSTTNPNSETTSFTLDAAGRTTRQDNANGTYVLNSFDSANRTTEIVTKNSGATVLSGYPLADYPVYQWWREPMLVVRRRVSCQTAADVLYF